MVQNRIFDLFTGLPWNDGLNPLQKIWEIFSIDDVTEGVLPDFGFNEVSLEYVHAENIGYKFYLKAEDWSWYTEDINARECGETIDGCGGFPDQEILSKMNKNYRGCTK